MNRARLGGFLGRGIIHPLQAGSFDFSGIQGGTSMLAQGRESVLSVDLHLKLSQFLPPVAGSFDPPPANGNTSDPMS